MLRINQILFCLGAVLLLMSQGCTPVAPINKIAGPTMGTEYHISWVSQFTSANDIELERLDIQRDVNAILISINQSMSTYDSQSELSIINSQFKEGWQEISADLYRVLMMAMQVNVNSEGAFDITVGPLVNLWGFGPNKSINQAPSEDAVAEQLAQVGAKGINLRQRDESFELKLEQVRYIDLSAIAKGYAVDVIARYLSKAGIDGYLVEVGGEIIAHGVKAEGVLWKIAIEAPNDDGRTAQLVIPLSNMGVATSGDYRNFFEQDGRRFSHTIDGRTGYPVDHGLASVSVLHESVAMADAWATALTVLGAEKGLALAEKHGLAAFFIQRTAAGFKQHTSSQFEQLRLN